MPLTKLDLADLTGGQNQHLDPRDIGDNQFQKLQNMEYTRQGRLATRRGVRQINTTSPSFSVDGIISSADLNSPRWTLLDETNNLLYVTSNDGNSLTVWDVSDKTRVRPRSGISDNTNLNAAAGMALDPVNNVLYVCARGAGTSYINSVDVSDPDNLTIRDSLATPVVGAVDVEYYNGYVFVTSKASNALMVFNVSDPDNITHDNTLTDATNLNGAYAIDIKSDGSKAYISAMDGDRLTVVDISTPTAPSVDGSVTDALLNVAQKLVYSEAQSQVYVITAGGAGFGAMVVSVDVATPASPSVEDSLDLGDSTNTSTDDPIGDVIEGEAGFLLFTSFRTDEVHIIDKTDVANLSTVAQIVTNDIGDPRALAFHSSQEVTYIINDANDTIAVMTLGMGGLMEQRSTYSSAAATADTAAAYRLGNTIYTVDSANNALNQWDITDPDALGEPSVDQDATDLAGVADIEVWEVGGIRYAAMLDTGTPALRVWQVSGTPASLFNSASFGTGSNTGVSLKKVGNYLYVLLDTSAVSSSQIMRIYDVSTPSSPALQGTLLDDGSGDLNNPGNLVGLQDANYVLFVGNNGGSSKGVVVDVTDKTSPSIHSKFNLVSIGAGRDVEPVMHPNQELLYVPQNSGRLYVYDTSDPAAITQVANVPSGFTNLDALAIEDATAPRFIFGGTEGVNTVVAFSLADPRNPVVTSSISNANTSGARVYPTMFDGPENTVYAFADPFEDRLTAFDTQFLAEQTLHKLAEDVNLDGPRSVQVENSIAYVASSVSDALSVVDLATLTAPHQIGRLVDATNLNGTRDLYVNAADNEVYMTAWDGDRLTVVDITDPTAPSVSGSVTNATTLNQAAGVAYKNNTCYVAVRGNNGIAVVDVTDPTTPAIVGTLSDGVNLAQPEGIAVDEDDAYVYTVDTVNGRFVVIDVSTPSTPVIDNQINNSALFAGGTRVRVSGSYAYVTGETNSTFVVVDISDPTAPSVVGSITDAANLNVPRGLWIDPLTNRAYVASGTGDQLVLIDISTKTAPAVQLTKTDAGIDNPAGVWGAGNTVVMVNEASDNLSTLTLSGAALTGRITSIFQYEEPTAGTRHNLVTSGSQLYEVASNGIFTSLTGTLVLPNDTFWTWRELDGLAIGANGGGTGFTSLVKWDGTGNASPLTTDLPAGNTAKFLEVWNFRLFVSAGSTLYYSALGDPTDFSSVTAGAIEIDPDHDGDITGLISHKGLLFIFKRNSIYRLQPGVPNTSASRWSVEPVAFEIGCISGYSIAPVLDDVVFLSKSGLASLAAADQVGDFQAALVSNEIPSLRDLNMERDDYPAVVDTIHSQYIVSVASDNISATNDIAYVLDFKSTRGRRWTEFTGTPAGTVFGTIFDANGEKQIWIGSGENLYERKRPGDANEFDDAGSAISTEVLTKDFDFQQVTHRKRFERFALDAEKLGSALELTAEVVLDSETSAPSNRSFTLDFDLASNPLRVHRKIPGFRNGVSGALKLTTSAAGEGYELRRVSFWVDVMTHRRASVI